MKLPQGIKIYGDIHYRDKNCRKEWEEQKEFNGFIKELRPKWHRLAVHPKNEGKRNDRQAQIDQEQGALNTGASDIIIPARIPFVCELKRADHTQSSISKDQVGYLVSAQESGAFACIALGCKGAWLALLDWEQNYLK